MRTEVRTHARYKLPHGARGWLCCLFLACGFNLDAVAQPAGEEIKHVEQTLDAAPISMSALYETRGGSPSTLTFTIRAPQEFTRSIDKLSGPNRLVIDLHGVTASQGRSETPIDNPWVQKIRTGLHGDTTRIVLDLKGDTFPRYEISSSSSAITVIFGEQSSAASNAAVSAELPETSDIQSFLIVERPDITITGDLGSAGITMKNSSASAVLVSSSVSKVVASPSTDQSAEQPSKDILVSPCRFELAPGSARTISVVLAGTRQDTEQIYRVRLTPAAGTIVGQTESVLVLVPPLNGIPKLTWRTTDNGLVLSNEGNASIELASGTFCPRALSLCQSIPNRRLLPGESWELALVESGQLDFWTRKGDASQERMSILVEHHG